MDPLFNNSIMVFMAGIIKAVLHLFLLWLAWKHRNVYVGMLAVMFMAVQLTVITESPPIFYIITSGLAHPMLAWVLYLYMRESNR